MVVPAFKAVAKPAALIVAVTVVVETQVTEFVRFCVLLSLYIPVAVNCCEVPFAIEGLAGAIAIDTSVGTLTVKTIAPLIAPEVA